MNILRRKKRSCWMLWSSPACLFHTSCCLLHIFLCQHKLCATVVLTGLREPEQVETHLPNTTAARERLWLSLTVLCQFKSVELQPQPDHTAGKSYRIFVEYNGKRKKLKTTYPTPAHLLPDWQLRQKEMDINCSWFLVIRIVSSIHGIPTATR